MSWVRLLAEAIGWFMLAAWILGVLGVIDLHVCIRPTGKCTPYKGD